jgi:hypothetical protein
MSDNTLTDKILAIAALALLVGFLGVLVWYVPAPALTVICLLIVVMAAYDFFRMAFLGKS